MREVNNTSERNIKQCAKKINYTKNDLPFPSLGREGYNKRWVKDFKTSIISWAGTTKDPFGTNGMVELEEVVDETWLVVYPELAEALDNEAKRAAILGVVRLNNSRLRSFAYNAVSRLSLFLLAGAALSANRVSPLSRKCGLTKTPRTSRTTLWTC